MNDAIRAPIPPHLGPISSTLPRAAVVALLVSSAILVLYGAVAAITTSFLACNLAVSRLNLAAATLATIVFLVAFSRRTGLSRAYTAAAAVLLLAAVAAACLVASSVLDLTWDGQDYQQRAIQALLRGWNPVTTVLAPANDYYNLILDHYPKAPWYAAASIAAITSSIEVAKATNLLLIVAAFGSAFAFFSAFPRLRGAAALLLALLVAANPVSLYQSLSFYVDGQVASILSTLIALSALMLLVDTPPLTVPLLSAIVLAVNVKFTSAVYSLPFLALAAVLSIALPIWPAPSIWRRCRLLVLALVGLAAGCLVGVNPYVSNVVEHSNPLFPVFGSDELDVLSAQAPSDFVGANPAVNLARSLFSPSANTAGQPADRPKNPFSFGPEEIAVFATPDVRLGGFGPLFAASLVLSILSILLLHPLSGKGQLPIAAFIALLLLSVALNPGGWWARYAPQLWLLPLTFTVLLTVSSRPHATIGRCVLAGTLALNVLLVSAGYFPSTLGASARASTLIRELALSRQPILVYFGPFVAVPARLDRAGIIYSRVESAAELPCPDHLDPLSLYSPLSCSP